MEKNSAHCRLSRVGTLIENGKVRLTASAVFGARQLGFTEREAVGVVMSLTTADFYKGMPTIRSGKTSINVAQSMATCT